MQCVSVSAAVLRVPEHHTLHRLPPAGQQRTGLQHWPDLCSHTHLFRLGLTRLAPAGRLGLAAAAGLEPRRFTSEGRGSTHANSCCVQWVTERLTDTHGLLSLLCERALAQTLQHTMPSTAVPSPAWPPQPASGSLQEREGEPLA